MKMKMIGVTHEFLSFQSGKEAVIVAHGLLKMGKSSE